MTQEAVIEMGQQALWIAAQVAAPVVLAGLVVGVLVSVFQAATQIQEQSLVFVPKIIVLILALSLCGSWMLTRLVDFSRGLILSIPTVIR